MGRRPAVVLVLVAVAAVLGGVLVVTRGDPDAATLSPAATSRSSAPVPSASPTTAQRRLPRPADLLGPAQLGDLGAAPRTADWRVQRTDDNTAGTGLHSICQQRRFADPQGLATTVRTFRSPGTPTRFAVQTVEASSSERRARTAYRTILGWYAGCQAARLQLLDAYAVSGVGDRAEIVSLRLWRRPASTLTVALARTGTVTTTTVTTLGVRHADPRRHTRLLAEAVRRLCPRNGRRAAARSGSPGCVSTPRFRTTAPPPTTEPAGQLAVVDLPPVGRIDRAWVGTRSVTLRSGNPARTTCDRADFSGARNARTRTYLIPEADLPRRFGLTETAGTFRSADAAERFLADVRREVGGCERRDLATSVDSERHVRGTPRRSETSVWRLSTRITARERVAFRLGFVRVGRSVAQLTLTPSDRADMTQAVFDRLLLRAGERLRGLA